MKKKNIAMRVCGPVSVISLADCQSNVKIEGDGGGGVPFFLDLDLWAKNHH